MQIYEKQFTFPKLGYIYFYGIVVTFSLQTLRSWRSLGFHVGGMFYRHFALTGLDVVPVVGAIMLRGWGAILRSGVLPGQAKLCPYFIISFTIGFEISKSFSLNG